MGCTPDACNDSRSDWYQWVTTPSIVAEGLAAGDPVEDGPAHWQLLEADLDRAKSEMGHSGFRHSFEWSRLFPQSTEGATTDAEVDALADAGAVARYHEILAHMRRIGMTPLFTLNHYSLPVWIHDGVSCHADRTTCADKGWLDGARLIPEMTKYAKFVAREFGSEIDLWATLNEPFAVVLAGYVLPTPAERTNPPAVSDLTFESATTVIQQMIFAHASIYDAIHAADTVDADGDGTAAMVGLVPNLAPVATDKPDTDVGRRAEQNALYLYNRYFLDALVHGAWDPDFDGEPNETRADLKGRMDFVGINYYIKLEVTALDNAPFARVPTLTFLPDPFGLGAGYPPGLYEMSMFVKRDYDLPIYITENDFTIPHVAWLKKAMNEGADVRGYFNWTFVDNYEWNHGFEFKLGLYSYDAVTKERTAKPRVALYREVVTANGLTKSLIDREIGEWLPPDAELDAAR